MAQAKQPDPEPGGGFIRGAVRTAVVVVTALVIIWLTLWGFAGTAGFRRYLEGRIGEAAGIEVEIVGSRATLGGTLVLREVRSAGMSEPGHPGIRIGTLTLRPRWYALLGGSEAGSLEIVTAEDWSVHFQLDETGRWRPEGFDAVTGWLNKWGSLSVPGGAEAVETRVVAVEDADAAAEKAAAETFDPGAWTGANITLRDGDLLWSAADGRQLALAEGASFTFRPLALPTRKADHFHLVIEHAVLPDADVDDIDVELLKTGDLYLVINLQARRQRRAMADAVDSPEAVAMPRTAAPPPVVPREAILRDVPSSSAAESESDIRAKLREAMSGPQDGRIP